MNCSGIFRAHLALLLLALGGIVQSSARVVTKSRALAFWILVIMSMMAISPAFSIPPVTNGLVAAYEFSGNANDISGNAHNGTTNGATLTTDRFGNANNAYYFNVSYFL
ncbi:hypothetical protein CCP4SC76_5380005 [Gammaproteobacteria bacterium]